MSQFCPCISCFYQDSCTQDKYNSEYDCRDYVFMDKMIPIKNEQKIPTVKTSFTVNNQ